jgi:hypothetical protein
MNWTAPWYKNLYLRIAWPWWRFKSRLRFRFTGNCGFICGYTEPYGFVPEAGCPIHDE